ADYPRKVRARLAREDAERRAAERKKFLALNKRRIWTTLAASGIAASILFVAHGRMKPANNAPNQLALANMMSDIWEKDPLPLPKTPRKTAPFLVQRTDGAQ